MPGRCLISNPLHLPLLLLYSVFMSACSLFDDDERLPVNIETFNVSLSGLQVSPPVTTPAFGNGEITVNQDSGEISGTVTTTGITANGVDIHQAYSGDNGPVLIALEQDSGNQAIWRVSEGSVLDDDAKASLSVGELYINIRSDTFFAGEIRGQILPDDIEIIQTLLSSRQERPPLLPINTAVAVTTLNTVTNDFTLHLKTQGLDDAGVARVQRGLAGSNGTIVFELQQDNDDVEHWFLNMTRLDPAQRSQLDGAEYYVNVPTPAFPEGEVRGQIIRAPYEFILVELDGDQHVPSVATDATAVGALTLNTTTKEIDVAVNTVDLADANAVHIQRGFTGTNGSVELELSQDLNEGARWTLKRTQLTDNQYDHLRASGFYFNVLSPSFPSGEVRGQIVPAQITPLLEFTVSGLTPTANETVTSLPTTITVFFNDDVDPTSLTPANFRVRRAGSDSRFDDGSDILLTVNAVNVLPGNANAASVDIRGNNSVDDLYQVTVFGVGASPVVSISGAVLDGDQDGVEGGDFSRNFTVEAAVQGSQATLSSIQAKIFTPVCSACHGAGVANAGMRVNTGNAFENLVNVASTEVPALFRVAPGDPDNSYIVQKLEGTAAIGARMPFGGPFLPQSDINLIRQWISNAAQDN